MNPMPDVSYEPVWPDPDANDMEYLYSLDSVDFYLDYDGDHRGRYGANSNDWTHIGERDGGGVLEDWLRAPQSARDHLTALAALHR